MYPPNKPVKPSGPLSGKTGISYTYSTSTTDSDGDQLYYWFDWGDGNYTGPVGPYDSGETASAEHAWSEKGNYEIKVKAMDITGRESPWSDPLPVTMPKNKQSNNQQNSQNNPQNNQQDSISQSNNVQQSTQPLFLQILERLLQNIR